MNENTYSYTTFCGIDISKDYFDYCLFDKNKQIISHDKLAYGRSGGISL